MIWKGESAEQLVDSLGLPARRESLDSDSSVKEIWDYDKKVGYACKKCKAEIAFAKGLRIVLEDKYIVDWSF